jgi:hypothetical protein
MAKTQAYVVHDETGRIVSIGRVSKGAKAIKLCGEGQSMFETEVDDGAIEEMIGGGYTAHPGERAVKPYKK